jgi:MraZ protein
MPSQEGRQTPGSAVRSANAAPSQATQFRQRRKEGSSGQMTQFMGTHHNRLDAKGRVSIPAPFRGTLRGAAPEGAAPALVLRPSHKHPCIEGWPAADFHQLGTAMRQLETFSEVQDDLAFALYADAAELTPDKEGRIVLPEALIAHAEVEAAMVFVGLGTHFQIWEPQALARRRAEALDAARSRGFTLPGRA